LHFKAIYVILIIVNNSKFIQFLQNKTRINQQIRAKEVRTIGADGANLGVLSVEDAIEKAKVAGLDLIEISPSNRPPVAKIEDYGKYQYTHKKKQREAKAKSQVSETKTIQVKIGTGEHDLLLKAKKVARWLDGKNRIKIDLFLWGRYKYMEKEFLEKRLQRFLNLIPQEYQIVDEVKKSPKGLTTIIGPGGKISKK